jgi:hypothetical protein
MTFTSTVSVSKIELYPEVSDPTTTLAIEHTTSVLQDGALFATNVVRTEYDVTSADGKTALTQALSDAGIAFVTVS